jgi:hypothetical protein
VGVVRVGPKSRRSNEEICGGLYRGRCCREGGQIMDDVRHRLEAKGRPARRHINERSSKDWRSNVAEQYGGALWKRRGMATSTPNEKTCPHACTSDSIYQV